jgi:hypothetical protein
MSLSTSSNTEPISSSPSPVRPIPPIAQLTNTTPKLFVYNKSLRKFYSLIFHRHPRGITLFPCSADNYTELSFGPNEIVTESKLNKHIRNNFI